MRSSDDFVHSLRLAEGTSRGIAIACAVIQGG